MAAVFPGADPQTFRPHALHDAGRIWPETNRYVDLVGEGYDVALRAGKPEHGDLLARKVASYALCLVASPSYLRSAPLIQSRADLGGHAGHEEGWRDQDRDRLGRLAGIEALSRALP